MKEDVKDVNIVITMADGDFQTISKWEEKIKLLQVRAGQSMT